MSNNFTYTSLPSTSQRPISSLNSSRLDSSNEVKAEDSPTIPNNGNDRDNHYRG
jgi:hypothetical protein